MDIATLVLICALALAAAGLIGVALVLIDRRAVFVREQYKQVLRAANIDGAQLSRLLAERAERQAEEKLRHAEIRGSKPLPSGQ